MRYTGFISYSRKDARIAKRLHRALERFRVPGGVASAGGRRRLGRFFRDDDELRASEHLGAALDGAIDESETLIVIASPDAARSPWVEQEIRRFKRRGAARVLAVIVGGTPNSGDAATECFPRSLTSRVDAAGNLTVEPGDPPLAADLTKERFARVLIRLVAGLLDTEFDALWRRERRRTRRRRAIAAATLILAASATATLAARAVTANDLASLRDRSVEISSEQWRYFGDPQAFDPALRAALAAARLDRPDPRERWALNRRSESTSRALALSGRLLPARLIFGQPPPVAARANYRDDIPGADPAQRVAIHASSSARDLAFSPNAARLGLTASHGYVAIHDASTGRRVYAGALPDVDAGAKIALDDDGTHALVGTRGRVHLIQATSRAISTCETPELESFHELSWHDRRWLFAATGTSGSVVGALDPATCRITERTAIPPFTPYNSHAFTTAAAATLFVGFDEWEGLTRVERGFRKASSLKFDGLGDGAGQVKVIAVDATRNLVALGGNGSGGRSRAGVQIVSLDRGTEAQRLVGHTGEVYAVDFMPGTTLIATGGSDLSVRVWNVTTGDEVLRLAGHLGDIHDVHFSPDGMWLATASSDGTVLLWDAALLRDLGRRPLWERARQREPGEWSLPSTIITPEERGATAAFQGRPWDVLEWEDPRSLHGTLQSVRAMLVRWFGWTSMDYERAPSTDEAGRRRVDTRTSSCHGSQARDSAPVSAGCAAPPQVAFMP